MVTHLSRLRRLVSAMPVLLVAGLFAGPLMAGPGHDHSNDGGGAAAVAANPRGSVQTNNFQAVAIQFGTRILVYLDDPVTNTPISGAEIELTPPGGAAVSLSDRGDGVYVADLLKLPVGHNSLMLFVSTDSAVDLLNIDIDIPEAGAAAATVAPVESTGRGTLPLLIAVPIAIAIGVLISSQVTRATRRRRLFDEDEAEGAVADLPPAGVVMAGADPASVAVVRSDSVELAGSAPSRPVA